MRWAAGEKVVEFLLECGRLESVSADVEAACDALWGWAAKRLETARAAIAGEDWEGAFSNAYDVYRMAAEVLYSVRGCGLLAVTGHTSPWRTR